MRRVQTQRFGIRILVMIIGLITPTAVVFGQVSEEPAVKTSRTGPDGAIHIFGSRGSTTHKGINTPTIHFGAALIGFPDYDDGGFILEVGYHGPENDLSDGTGILNWGYQYHWRQHRLSPKVIPFITVGYSQFFGNKVQARLHVGTGIQSWINDQVGVRIELRDYIDPTRSQGGHAWGWRAGMTFAIAPGIQDEGN